MLTWKTLHVLSMITMTTLFIGAEIFYASAIWRRDVRALAFVHRTVERTGLGIAALLAMIAGVVFGLVTAATGGFDFVAPWLIVAYLLVAVFFVNAAIIGKRVVDVAKDAVKAEDGAHPAEDVVDDMANSRAVFLVAFNAVLFVVIVADMILKPSL
jgi:hypothetical protein